MSAADRQRQKEIFHTAADLAGDEREAFLECACEGDASLRREIDSLLAYDHEEEDEFSETNIGIGHELLARAVADGGGTASIPERIGRYRIIEKLGDGGMGTVYLAEQDHPNRRVALKMIRPGMVSPSLLRRFRHEEDLLGRLQHPGIAQIHEAGEIDLGGHTQPYFAMEYVDGVELREYARRHELGTGERLELVARISDAVSHAHQKGIIHRDLKPDNVLVVDGAASSGVTATASFATLGQPKILDFGVARATDADARITTILTDVGQLIGTVQYMSPEQMSGDVSRPDTRSDIYALGVILYELLSGQLPFRFGRKSIPEAARIVQEDEPKHLGSIQPIFRGDIDTIVMKALEKDPGRRYQSAAEFAADIRRYLADEPITAHPPSTFYQLSKFARRNKGLVAGIALSFLILIAGVVTSLTFAVRAVHGEHLAKDNEERAVESENQARENERRALRAESVARRSAYRLSITAADATGQEDPLQALDHLASASPADRGWEWQLLNARFQAPTAISVEDRHSGYASTIGCLGDGRLIAALQRNGVIELVDPESGDVLSTIRNQSDLAIPNLSPDGSRLAAVIQAEQKLIIWDVPDGSRLLELPLGSIDAQYTRFNSDGSLVATSSAKDGMSVIETETGCIRFQTSPAHKSTSVLAFDETGERVAVVTVGGQRGDNFILSVYSVDGECVSSKAFGDGSGCGSLVFSPDGTRLAVGHVQRMIRVLDASTLEVVDVLQGHTARVDALAFSSDGSCLASSSQDGTNRIWAYPRGEVLRVLAGGGATSLLFAAEDNIVVSGSTAEVRISAWQSTDHRVLRGHQSYVYRVAFSPDGATIASGEFGETIRLWDALTGEPLAVIAANRPDRALGFTTDGARLVAFDRSEPTYLAAWDSACGIRLTAPRNTNDEALLANTGNPESDWWLRYSRAVRGSGNRVDETGEDVGLAFNGSLLALGTATGEIKIIDASTGQTLRQIGKHDGTVCAVTFSPDHTRVVSGGKDQLVRVWDLASGVELARMDRHLDYVYSVDYSPDGTRIASGSNDETVRIWDAETFDQVAVLRGHESYVHCVTFSPDGTMLASASGDGTVRVWDTVPPADRWRQIRRDARLRREVEHIVDRMSDELDDPLEVADRLRGQPSLSDAQRQQALKALLRRSAGEHLPEP